MVNYPQMGADTHMTHFTARRYANAVYAVVVFPSVRRTPVLYQNGET